MMTDRMQIGTAVLSQMALKQSFPAGRSSTQTRITGRPDLSPRAGAERFLGFATSSDRLASGGVSECRTAGSIPATGAITQGPATRRSAMLEMCLALAAGWGKERWSQENCAAQVKAGLLALIQAHDMQIGSRR